MQLPLAIALFAGCSRPDGGLPEVVYEPASPMLFDAPWPSDARLVSGSPDLAGFPNPAGLDLVDTFVALAADVPGWGTTSPVYLRFHDAIDVSTLPDPDASIEEGSAIQLVDVDPSSPEWGRRWPVMWEYTEDATAYQAAHLLAVAPLHGFPLRPHTRYAVFVTTELAQPGVGFEREWRSRQAGLAPLGDTLWSIGVQQDQVAAATVFTTGGPTDEMALISRFLRENVEIPVLSQQVVPVASNLFFDVYAADYPAPYFTHGERPYSQTGGGFRFDDAGRPVIAGWDDMRLSICVPKRLDSPPPGGWPVSLQQHGTGGNYLSHCNSAIGLEVASQLAAAGIVAVGIDQPLHATRGGERDAGDFDHFNFLNPESGRTNFRQGALDAVFLAHALASQDVRFTLPDGRVVALDPDRVTFLGHSQGALTGALALPFFGDDVKASVLSAAGGELGVTLVERKDPMDIKALVESIGGFEDGEELTPMHPLAGLIQGLVEVTDPVNYGPFWFERPAPGFPDAVPASVLLTSGTLDAQTPTDTSEILASAAGLPRLAWSAPETSPALALRDVPAVWPPFESTATGFDGEPVTATFTQWPGLDHWAIWEDTDLAEIYREFLKTASYEDQAAIRLEE